MKNEATKMIAISDLEKSPLNARKTIINCDDLKASILAHGLMQNLVVTNNPKGGYHVVAGSRRLEAMKQLNKEKKADIKFVPCQVVDSKESSELSLVENTIRQAMHPADEFEAYLVLNKQGLAAIKIAERFGVTEKHVLQRLKMSQVHADIIKEYKAGKINLDVVMAFTLSPDTNEQLKIFKKLTKYEREDGDRARRIITNKLPDGDDKYVKFIGLENYKKAGGKVRADLFGEDVYIEDQQLLSKLVKDKLENTKKSILGEGWMWCETALESDYNFTNRMDHIYHNNGKYKKEEMKNAGVYVTIGYHGSLDVKKGLIRPTEKKLFKKGKDSDKPAEKKEMTEGLRHDLRETRRQLMQVVLTRNPEIAFDMTVYRLALEAKEKSWYTSGLEIKLPDTGIDLFHAEYESFEKKLDLSWLKIGDEVKQFQAFEKLSKAQKMDILAWASARGIEGNLYDKDRYDSIEYAIAKTETNPATLWRPTSENYFMKISKDQMLEICKEIFGVSMVRETEGKKKSDLAANLERYFQFNGIPAQKGVEEKLKNWMPKQLAFSTIKTKK